MKAEALTLPTVPLILGILIVGILKVKLVMKTLARINAELMMVMVIMI